MLNAMFLILIVFPITSALLGVIGFLIAKKIWIAPLLVLILTILFLYVMANGDSSFFIWIGIFPLISLITSTATWYTVKS
ncbi:MULTISPECIES: DUF2651 family protein [Bacillus]|uniref:DUF2651 domain-containing protein n=2 Tax=Bacillus TaxID=1386 RepID=A0A0M3RAH4_9BACI|nr:MULTISPECIES: DUF2651 family protein [Bacillus]ALC83192.1 hypothetical protein AM592_17705 [Bacillus gobiensis]MBP1082279.1 putative integral membrane protein [Bacillus capparidis]MED1096884.1 DUF2651 family protein [Bacillus capparidis]